MAKTLTQAGGRVDGGVLPTSQQISSSPTISPARIQSTGDSLSRDLLSIMGKAGAIVQEKNTLSVKAAQRVATDSLTNMSIDLEEYKSSIQPNTPFEEIEKGYDVIFQKYGRKRFDNEDAQKAFDSSYHTRGRVAVAGEIGKARQVAMKRDHLNIVDKLNQGIGNQLNTNVEQTKEAVDGYVDGYTAGGYMQKSEAYGNIVNVMNKNVKAKHGTNKSLEIYTNGKIDSELRAKEFNKYYSGLLSMDKNGSVSPVVDDVPTEVIASAVGNFKSLVKADKNTATDYNAKWGQSKDNMNTVITNGKNGKMSSTDLIEEKEKVIDSMKEAIEYGNSVPYVKEVTSTQRGEAHIKLVELQREIEVAATVEDDFNSTTISIEDMQDYLANGRTVELSDGLGGYIEVPISKKHYQNVASRISSDMSEDLYAINTETPEGLAHMRDMIVRADRFKQVTGEHPEFIQTHLDIYDENKSTSITDVNMIKRANAVSSYYSSTTSTLQKQRPMITEMNRVIQHHESKEKPDTMKMNLELNSVLMKYKTDSLNKEVDNRYQSVVDEIETEMSEGGTSLFVVENLHMDSGVNIAMKNYASSLSKGETATRNALEDLEVYDWGGTYQQFVGRDQIRTIVPNGVNGKVGLFEKSVDKMFSMYNDAYSTDYSQSNTVPETRFNKTTGDFEIEVFYDEGSGRGRVKIGTITSTNVYLSNRGED